MTPTELEIALSDIRWSPDTLARALECDVSLVDAWLSGEAEIPMKTGVWISLLAQHHVAFESQKPKSLKGKKFVI